MNEGNEGRRLSLILLKQSADMSLGKKCRKGRGLRVAARRFNLGLPPSMLKPQSLLAISNAKSAINTHVLISHVDLCRRLVGSACGIAEPAYGQCLGETSVLGFAFREGRPREPTGRQFHISVVYETEVLLTYPLYRMLGDIPVNKDVGIATLWHTSESGGSDETRYPTCLVYTRSYPGQADSTKACRKNDRFRMSATSWLSAVPKAESGRVP